MGIRLGVFVAALAGLTAVGGAPGAGSEVATAATEDPARRAVIDAFYDGWLHNQQVSLGWTGAVDGCDPGKISAAARAATRDQINYFRSAAGLRPVTFDSDLTLLAQRTALIMHANNQLSHEPPSWWKCHTVSAADLASRSNLALGGIGSGADAITRYVADSAHAGVAHRRWLLNPRTAEMAAGSTAQANALVVVGMPQHRLAVPAWIPWPPAGYLPAPLEPGGIWSLSAGNQRTDFSRAQVRVTDEQGTTLGVRVFPVSSTWGPPTLVWSVSGLHEPALAEDRTYWVRVTRVERGNERMAPVSWKVVLVRPDRPTVAVEQPVLSGTFAVGRQLSVSRGTWSPTPDAWTYQWQRDGEAIPGATYPSYWVQAQDEGHVVSVVVRAGAPYHVTGRAVLPGQRVAS